MPAWSHPKATDKVGTEAVPLRSCGLELTGGTPVPLFLAPVRGWRETLQLHGICTAVVSGGRPSANFFLLCFSVFNCVFVCFQGFFEG
jgi:hypothetical protein